ncbi:MAG: Chromosomal replication initiator protein DnaA [Candidatus Moranbacteria bacterium GW2011_GWF2_34_56]|nr:MAG: Chromosomal replication initiator protein DnaA [Candidatus Moranbacteria bacterium GW2011_GWF1_34_10]KKP65151.1 MAG: Chromosomal replication initiator protein DnaA [Candidatus Moranbacteria bacterium GW2011_GWF2_34_56]HBI17377.1 chromosomal replication initiator protein DnaA [Candidatus Moranbacteria bacterium]
MNNEDLWKAVLGEIELSLSRPQFITWFKDTFILSNENGKVIIGVPNGFSKEWLENKFNTNIIKALKNLQENITEVSCAIYSPQEKPSRNIDGAGKNNQGDQTVNLKDTKVVTPQINFFQNTHLNSRYTFDSFVIGENNELARAACYAVSQNPGTQYNPLFIYGDVGLGKTHLLQSIGNEILKNDPNKNIIYISSEGFTTELVNSIKNQTIDKFKNKYQQADLLIIDDIQFISGKEKTQDIFFHIFNSLYQLNKQIVISSDRPPSNIQILEDRLRSRFEGGMITDIGNPDLETRLAILQTKLNEKKFFLSDEILRFIAENIKNNIRELEGALNKLVATFELNKKNPTIEETKKILSSILISKQEIAITKKDIIESVLNFFEITKEDLMSKSRKKKVALPRQITMFLFKKELKMSYPEIGEYFQRDHTTALHAFNKISKDVSGNSKINGDIEYILKTLR